MLASHVDAEIRYSRLRKEALGVASEILKSGAGTGIALTEINAAALNASKAWIASKVRIKDWD